MTLTPNLLRDESSNNSLLNEWKDGRGSFESLDKGVAPQEKVKDDKKRKDKKSGMLSGFFKRKDKKSKATDPDNDEPLSPTDSSFRASPQPKTSMESLSQDSRSKPQRPMSNKLQKQPPVVMSPTATTDQTKENETVPTSQASQSSVRPLTIPEEDRTENSPGAVTSPASQPSPPAAAFVTPMESRDPLASPVYRPSSEAQRRGPYDAARTTAGQTSVTTPPMKFTPTVVSSRSDQGSESPVDVSPVEGHIPILAPGLTPDTAQRGQSGSPLSPPSSPEADSNDLKGTEATPGSLDTLSVDTPTWSDASLRSYMDEENDIRDLFIIVHDKSNIPPAGPDHPVTGRLFKEESKRLKEMNNQLDEMLVHWMSQRTRHSRTMRSVQSPST